MYIYDYMCAFFAKFTESGQMTYILIFGFAVTCSHLLRQPLGSQLAGICSHLSLKQVSVNIVL